MQRIQQALELSRRDLDGTHGTPPKRESLAVPRVVPASHAIRRLRDIHPLPEATCDRQRLVLGAEGDETAAAYRVIRSRMLQWLDAEGKSVVAMVSAAHDEGKTLSAVNLALCLAQDTNHTVLLVDLDLRSPSVHRYLELDVAHGLERFIDGTAVLEDLFVPVLNSRLVVLPCLSPVPGASEILAGQGIRNLVAELRLRYADRIILFDLPPALVGDEALVFLPLADAVLVVIGEGTTRKDHLVRLAEVVGEIPVIGSILNRARALPRSARRG
ncbi:MAG: CpsD/CapB family tyrosine-protein kinase [Gammaproteobacteria bacterium]|nr:CpsD/CapB family tyrosine-protein kinase [Gammaproteobacteria bacterium]